MARHSAGVLVPGIDLASNTSEPLNAQLFKALREHVIKGALEPGVRMPSSRTLARDIGVSRTTVSLAYDQLKSEGYLQSREKSGTFVTDVLPDNKEWRASSARVQRTSQDPLPIRLAQRLDRIEIGRPERSGKALPLHPGIPSVYDFPVKQYASIQRQVSLCLAPAGIARCPAEGAPELREEVAAYLTSSRGVVCDSSQVFIISGTRQALHLLLLALSNPGEAAWAEDPGYPGWHRALDLFRLRKISVPVDREGIVVSEGLARERNARFAYVTPARQAPLGHTMTINRRIELLNWAYDRDALILEDDYDGEYRFGGHPAPSLQSLDPDGRVIYFGTFSKTLLPSLGIGYLVVPQRYVPVIAHLLDSIARPPSLGTQITVARFLECGAFETHIRRMRSLYQQRQNALLRTIRSEARDLIEPIVLNAGLHLIGYLPEGLSDRQVGQEAARHGLLPRPMSDFVLAEKQLPALMLGFASLSEDAMPGAVARLRRAITNVQQTRDGVAVG